jgi:hypothetical protein
MTRLALACLFAIAVVVGGTAGLATADSAVVPSTQTSTPSKPAKKYAQNTCMSRCLAQYYTCDRGCQGIQNAEQYGRCTMGCVSGRYACESRC